VAREQALLDRGGFVLPPSPTSAVPDDPAHRCRGAAHDPTRRTGRHRRHQAARQGSPPAIPVDAPGALFSAGDAHFAQGDCEICGTAIEMRATLHVRFGLRKGEAAEKGIRDLRFTREDYYEERHGTLTTEAGPLRLAGVPGGYESFYRGMAAAIRDGGPVPVPAEEARDTILVIECALRSNAEGRTVAVPGQ
jgi:predicted dehydrogenase